MTNRVTIEASFEQSDIILAALEELIRKYQRCINMRNSKALREHFRAELHKVETMHDEVSIARANHRVDCEDAATDADHSAAATYENFKQKV